MPLTTANTILKSSATDSGYTKLCDILNYPDLGGAPNKLDDTTLTQTAMKTSILGLQEAPDLTFEANYDEAVFNTIKGMTAPSYYFELDFGTTDGTFKWQGGISVYANGGGVDEVRKMTIVISASTSITFATN